MKLPDVTREKGLKRLQAAGDISESPLQSMLHADILALA